MKERITAQGDLGGGYVVLLSGKGTVLLHPRMDTVEGRSVRSVAAQAKDTVLRRFSDSLDQGSLQGDLIRPGPRPCTDTRLKYRRLPDLGWTLLGVIPDRTGHPWCSAPWKRLHGTPAGR